MGIVRENFVPPPSEGDILLAARSLDWPRFVLSDGREGEGEAAWRGVIEGADGPARMAVWEALGAMNRPA